MEIVIFIEIVLIGVLAYAIYNKSKLLNNTNDELTKQKKRITEQRTLNETLKQQENDIRNQCAAQQSRYDTLKDGYEVAQQGYLESLELKKKEFLQQYNESIEELNIERESYLSKLNSLKATYAASIEAKRQEAERQADIDFYRLDLPQSELSDIQLLRNIQPNFSNPRIISKLIWQTYYQPIAKNKFPMIIGKDAICGIYKITNLITEESYIGQAVNVYKRFCEHCKHGLGMDTPQGNKLYAAMLKDGLNNFSFEVLEECQPEELDSKEKFYIEMYCCVDYGYNSINGHKSKE